MRAVAREPVEAFHHAAFLYRSDEEFVAGVGEFVLAGIDEGAAMLVAEPPARLALLRDAVGPAGDAVTWVDMTAVGRNPARIIPVWHEFVAAHRGRPIRGVGEPAYVGRTAPELEECRLHEHLLNRAFDQGLPWQLLCPYDERGLPAEVVDGALRTHPAWATAGDDGASHDYRRGGEHDDFTAPLPLPDHAERMAYGAEDVDVVRRVVGDFARSCGVPPGRVDDLVLAAHEIAANSVRYGGGSGVLGLWREPGAAYLQFVDAGYVADPLVGRRVPSLGQEGGRGVFLVNQLCDLVQLRSSAHGTTIRVTHWL